MPTLKNALKKWHRCRIPHRPTELFIIHRIHLQSMFLTWDKKFRFGRFFLLHLDTQKRTSLYIMIAAIFDKKLNCLTCQWTFLHFVKNYNRLAWYKIDSVNNLQRCKDKIQSIITDLSKSANFLCRKPSKSADFSLDCFTFCELLLFSFKS